MLGIIRHNIFGKIYYSYFFSFFYVLPVAWPDDTTSYIPQRFAIWTAQNLGYEPKQLSRVDEVRDTTRYHPKLYFRLLDFFVFFFWFLGTNREGL